MQPNVSGTIRKLNKLAMSIRVNWAITKARMPSQRGAQRGLLPRGSLAAVLRPNPRPSPPFPQGAYTAISLQVRGYESAKEEFGASEKGGGPWCLMINPETGVEIDIEGVECAIMARTVTNELKRLNDGATKLSSSELSDARIAKMQYRGVGPASPPDLAKKNTGVLM